MPRYTVTPIAAVAAFSMMLFGGAGLAQADDSKSGKMHHGSHFMEMFDTSGDSKVMLKEITADQARLFGAVDVNEDKALSVDEFRRRGRLFCRYSSTTLFDMLDSNGDQKLTLDEISGPSERWFKRYDANKDGVMAVEEVPQGRWSRGRYGRRGHH